MNQGILTFKNVYMITMDHWNPHLEVRTLVIVRMAMNTLSIIMKRVMQKVNLIRRNNKY